MEQAHARAQPGEGSLSVGQGGYRRQGRYAQVGSYQLQRRCQPVGAKEAAMESKPTPKTIVKVKDLPAKNGKAIKGGKPIQSVGTQTAAFLGPAPG